MHTHNNFVHAHNNFVHAHNNFVHAHNNFVHTHDCYNNVAVYLYVYDGLWTGASTNKNVYPRGKSILLIWSTMRRHKCTFYALLSDSNILIFN